MKRPVIVLAAMALCGTIMAQAFEPIPFDKKYHIGAGVLAGTWGTFTGNSIELTPEQSALFGVAAATVAGIGKELMDVSERWIFKAPGARFDAMDIAATVEGGIIGAGLSYLALKIFKKKTVLYGDINNGFIVGVKVQL